MEKEKFLCFVKFSQMSHVKIFREDLFSRISFSGIKFAKINLRKN